MQEERFSIKYIAVQNCFVYLSDTWARRLDPAKINAIKISHDNNDYYVSWRPISWPDKSIRISATFALTLKLKDGDLVTVSSVPDPPFLSSITVTPRNAQDWEIVEYQAEKIQSILLDQISLVAKNQKIVAWVSKGLWVTLSVDATNSDFVYGAIGNGTEIHVSQCSPSAQKGIRKIGSSIDDPGVKKSGFNIWNIFRKISEAPPAAIDGQKSWIKNPGNSAVPLTFRVCSLSDIKRFCSTNDERVESPYDVFVHRTNFFSTTIFTAPNHESRLFRLRKVREDRQTGSAASTDFLRNSIAPKEPTELVVRLRDVEEAIGNCRSSDWSIGAFDPIHRPIYVSANLRRNLRLRTGSKILLEPSGQSESIASIEILPSTNSVTRRDFEEFLVDSAIDDQTLLNFPSTIYLKNGTGCVVRCTPAKSSHCLVDVAKLSDVVINVDTEKSAEVDCLEDPEAEQINLDAISLGPLKSTLDECRIILELSLALKGDRNFRYDPGNILVCGAVGAGKSTLCKVLREEMQKAPHFAHTHLIECKALKGKKVEAIHKIISTAMSDCIYHQPSVLFLDDLESITSSPADDEGNTPDAINAARILDVIFNIAAEYQASHFVSIVATCTDTRKVGPNSSSPGGVHLFRTVLAMPDLTQDQRIDILRLALRSNIRRVPEAINWDYYGSKTEGWVAQDLVDFAEKAAFAAWKRHVHGKKTTDVALAEEDLCETLRNYKTISLHGVQLFKSSGHDWSNIGGLGKVKEMLTQLLEWPLKHPELYRNSPIKNQNGVLLYGMPGTGKTILAGAIAAKCDLNLISIKGPELLSKYIGASEEAVRNIFEKARRAKPCVLFFDEFDSLAPRRGHDSTGVTDRVVNQLLTQLDGVEGREGVAVVAASSRPDLLDPALLRPGRLDKSLLCPLPDENDREEILTGLCKVQSVDTTNLDLKELAKLSSGFTGADINAALTQAKYDALENALDNALPGQSGCSEAIKLTQKHIVDSLKATHPSLSTSEKERYRRIYGEFSKGKIFGNVSTMKQRATLA